MRVVSTLLAVAFCFTAGTVSAEPARKALPPTIAIIIDDMGHSLVEGERLANLDQPLTLAFLPYRPHTDSLARLAYKQHKEIMLHAPMANTRNYGLGPGGLTPEMDEQSMVTTLRRALQSIPHVQGVNNHMGSLLTQQLQPMDWVMKELFRYPVYFIDSRTIAITPATKVYRRHRAFPDRNFDVKWIIVCTLRRSFLVAVLGARLFQLESLSLKRKPTCRPMIPGHLFFLSPILRPTPCGTELRPPRWG